MPTGNMRRIESVLTGVAGSPYYFVGYFADGEGTDAECLTAWHEFVNRGPASEGGSLPAGAVLTTNSEIPIVNPVDGAVLEVRVTPSLVSTGTNTGDFLPPANQFLVRWRTGNYENRREVRGRTNIGPCPEDSTDGDGNLLPTVVSFLNNQANALISNPAITHVVWSKKNGLWWATQSASTWTQYAVLRSRRD